MGATQHPPRGLTKNGVTVCCERCKCVLADGNDGFDITVPLCITQAGITGTARLHCAVSAEGHRVELMQWNDADLPQTELSDENRERISATLRFVAEQQICGNPRLCPSQVSKIVAARGGR